jgi:dTDP-4-amino-4,6-dideoxygalactose transaminase
LTDDILPRLIGLPVAPDLTEPEVQRVVAAVRAGLSG